LVYLAYVAATGDVSEGTRKSTVTTYEAKRPLNILVAEDNRINQRIIKAVVEAFGHQVEIAENGHEAVTAHGQGDYDLILMDVRMPEMSGPDATKVIRQLTGDKSSIPIIAVTADAMKGHREQYFEAGMNECVTKPIDRGELLKAINKVLDEEIHVPVDVKVSKQKSEQTSETSNTAQDDRRAEQNPEVDDFLKQLQDIAENNDEETV